MNYKSNQLSNFHVEHLVHYKHPVNKTLWIDMEPQYIDSDPVTGDAARAEFCECPSTEVISQLHLTSCCLCMSFPVWLSSQCSGRWYPSGSLYCIIIISFLCERQSPIQLQNCCSVDNFKTACSFTPATDLTNRFLFSTKYRFWRVSVTQNLSKELQA